jgi:hypothetical protein
MKKLVFTLWLMITFIAFTSTAQTERSQKDSSNKIEQNVKTKNNQKMKEILLIGIDPKFLDPNSLPAGLTPEMVREQAKQANEKLLAEGYRIHNCLIDLGETAEKTIKAKLSEMKFDGIMIGAGIRILPPNTLLFEKVINLLHKEAPQATFCFNMSPIDTIEAVKRLAKN